MSEDRRPFVVYARKRDETTGHYEFHERAEAENEDAGRFAVKTLAADAEEAGAPIEILGLYDRENSRWTTWPWGCPGCGRAVGGPDFCGDCRRDRALGERAGTTRAEIEESTRPDRDDHLAEWWSEP